MSETPSRIWATGNTTTGSWNSQQATFSGPDETEYVRADLLAEAERKLAKADAMIGDLIECGPWYGETLIGFLARRAELTGG